MRWSRVVCPTVESNVTVKFYRIQFYYVNLISNKYTFHNYLENNIHEKDIVLCCYSISTVRCL
jgi:hypothetical protein